MDLLLLNIKELVQTGDNPCNRINGKAMSRLPIIPNAYLLVVNEQISDYGSMDNLGNCNFESADQLMEIDCSGRLVFPSFCDPDSHLLYPFGQPHSLRETIPVQRSRGIRINDKSSQPSKISEEDLYIQAFDHLHEVVRRGTGAIEIKSGYGLELEEEVKLLHIIRRLRMTTPLVIKSTFMGSHVLHEKYATPANYFEHAKQLLPVVAKEELADKLDLYYDPQLLSGNKAEMLLLAGIREGLNVKIHSDELGLSKLSESNLSVALEVLGQTGQLTGDAIEKIVAAGLFPVIMPGASFFHNLSTSSARQMIDAGLPVALATDFDPGSMPSCDMKFMMSLACIKYGMQPEEVINAATINAACLMGISEGYGSITRGKAANLFITKKIPSYTYFPYAFSSDLIEMVILDGEIQ